MWYNINKRFTESRFKMSDKKRCFSCKGAVSETDKFCGKCGLDITDKYFPFCGDFYYFVYLIFNKITNLWLKLWMRLFLYIKVNSTIYTYSWTPIFRTCVAFPIINPHKLSGYFKTSICWAIFPFQWEFETQGSTGVYYFQLTNIFFVSFLVLILTLNGFVLCVYGFTDHCLWIKTFGTTVNIR